MDRLKFTLAGCGLAALMAASGCRNLRSEVPAGRPYSSDGRQMPSVGFSSDPHPMVVWLFHDHPPIRERIAMAGG